jgi:hypothetical protein
LLDVQLNMVLLDVPSNLPSYVVVVCWREGGEKRRKRKEQLSEAPAHAVASGHGITTHGGREGGRADDVKVGGAPCETNHTYSCQSKR